MPTPKKANSSLSRTMSSTPKIAKSGARVQKETLTLAQKANVTKAKLLKQKGRMDEAKSLKKIGKELSAPGVKYGSSYDSASNKVKLNDERGMSAQRRGAYGARKAAQPYGEASRTNRRAQAQAKKTK